MMEFNSISKAPESQRERRESKEDEIHPEEEGQHVFSSFNPTKDQLLVEQTHAPPFFSDPFLQPHRYEVMDQVMLIWRQGDPTNSYQFFVADESTIEVEKIEYAPFN